jgi:transposase
LTEKPTSVASIPNAKYNPQELRSKILELHKAGMSQRKIAEILDIGRGLVRAVIENPYDFQLRLTERRQRVLELYKRGMSNKEIAEKLDIPCETVSEDKKYLSKDLNNGVVYNKQPRGEESKWYKVIERTGQELPFYERQGLVPTARKMYYRLIELGVLTKSEGNYDRFCKFSAEARKGVDSTYTKQTNLPKLPIDCFRDEKRRTLGDTDMSEPEEPTAAEPPDDPIEITIDAIAECKEAILTYDGSCTEGDEAVNPGRWYKQPILPYILCESETIQPDLVKFQEDRAVYVGATGGYPSTPFMYETCKRLKEMAEKYDWIEEIVILYFGDSDHAGQNIRRNVEAALEWYQGQSEEFEIPVPVELRLVAITPEQVKKFKLTGYQLEAFMTNEKRLKDFKEIILKAIDDCWDQDIYDENCPPEEYDYAANNEEEPEDIDPDNEYYEDTQLTYREKMVNMATEAFKEGWEGRPVQVNS